MSPASVTAIVQARMSSTRFPGKVLTPFRGQPILEHVVRAIETVLQPANVIIATSVESSDNAVVDFARARGTRVFRGDLANVLARFQASARQVDTDWILRINADSPMIDPEVLHRVVGAASDGVDVITTTRPRTFPKGRNAELIRRTVLIDVDPERATADEREHVTAYFYNRPDAFCIRNIESGHPEWADHSLAVDTPEDLSALERLTPDQVARFSLSPR